MGKYNLNYSFKNSCRRIMFKRLLQTSKFARLGVTQPTKRNFVFNVCTGKGKTYVQISESYRDEFTPEIENQMKKVLETENVGYTVSSACGFQCYTMTITQKLEKPNNELYDVLYGDHFDLKELLCAQKLK